MVQKPVSFVEKQCHLKCQTMSKLVGSLGSYEKKRYCNDKNQLTEILSTMERRWLSGRLVGRA
tara:strand:+ start:1557 stop:1745 length:189 start_codon:yes stop_codon:yes gene_type:complete